MDYSNRAGSKKGGGGLASSDLVNNQRRRRVQQLALEGVDLDRDPYITRHPTGKFECRLCLTLHPSESSYLTHTQGNKHQNQLARRQRLDRPDQARTSNARPGYSSVTTKKYIKIGRPGYEIAKIATPGPDKQLGLLINVKYPQIAKGVVPRYRFMSGFEQHVEKPSSMYQYLVIAAEPYDSIAIKMQARPVEKQSIWTYFHADTGEFYMQFLWPKYDVTNK